MNVKITEIALDWGVCPECLVNAIEALDIDCFSSVETLKELVGELPKSSNPFSYYSSWVYFCDEHVDDDSELTDATIEIQDVIF